MPDSNANEIARPSKGGSYIRDPKTGELKPNTKARHGGKPTEAPKPAKTKTKPKTSAKPSKASNK